LIKEDIKLQKTNYRNQKTRTKENSNPKI